MTTNCEVSVTGNFLADYGAWLLGCGATCARIERNVTRMAAAFGLKPEITIMPKQIQLAVECGGAQSVFTRRMKPCGINFDLNAELSRLSWEAADNNPGFEAVRERFDRITGKHYGGQWQILVLTSLANASFCRLFGGDWAAMLAVCAATAAGYRLKQLMLSRGADVRVTFMACAFISTVISAGAVIFGWGATPHVAIATGVLYLIPGVPYINSANDLIDRHYLCAFSRFADAGVLTVCLSAGLLAALLLMNVSMP